MRLFNLPVALVLVLLTGPFSGAQPPDSAKPVSISADTSLIDSLLQLSKASVGKGGLSDVYARHALDLSKRAGDEKRQGMAYNRLAWFFLKENNLNGAITYADSAGMMFEKTNHPEGLAGNYNLFAVIFTSFGKPEAAQNYYRQALDIYRQAGIESGELSVLNNLGVLYNEQKQFEKAREHHLRALALAERRGDTDAQARSFCNLGSSCRGLGKTQEALDYLKRSYFLRKSLSNFAGISESLTAMADVISTADSIAAFRDFSKKQLAPLGFSSVHQMLDTSLFYAELARSEGLAMRNYDVRSRMLDREGKFEEALKYEKLRSRLLDKTKMDENNLSAYANLWTRLQSEQQQNKILTLEKEQAQEALSKTRLRNLLSGALLVVLLAAGLLYFGAKRKLLSGRLELEQKNRELAQMEQQQQMAAMNAMLQGQESERERVSKDLHDSLGNLLSTVKMQLSALPGKEEKLQSVHDLIDEACLEVRKIARDMMPATLLRLGLPKALEELCNRQNQVHGLQIHFQHYGEIGRLAQPKEIMLYRICQELLQNAMKHAAASEVIVQLTKVDDLLHLTVEDNGTGFHPAAVSRENSLGLRSIESRVQFLGGQWCIESQPGLGTTVVVEAPLGEMN